MSNQPTLQRRVVEAAQAALRTHRYVAPIDVLVGVRWLASATVEDWRRGRLSPLAQALPVDTVKVGAAFEYLRNWARQCGLQPNEAGYLAGTRDRRPLVFADDDSLQRLFRTHWVSPELSDRQRERLQARQNRAPDLVVVSSAGDWTCTSCGIPATAGSSLFREDHQRLCLFCADFDHLVFLPSGNAALSRRARQESTLSVLVMRFNKRRKRYERQGILVDEAALERAESQCLADEDLRTRRRERDAERRAAQDIDFQAAMAAEIRRLFPGCADERARAIAEHAGTRGSGRVGRSAAGRALDEDAVRAAVIASIRHLDTAYDELVMAGVPRANARDRIRPDLERVLDRWTRPGHD
jgi:hypothetical protein